MRAAKEKSCPKCAHMAASTLWGWSLGTCTPVAQRRKELSKEDALCKCVAPNMQRGVELEGF